MASQWVNILSSAQRYKGWLRFQLTYANRCQWCHICDTSYLASMTLQWSHNDHDIFSNNQLHDCLLNRLFRCRSTKTSKHHVTGLCAGNSPVTGEFPAQKASNAENVSIWWHQHDNSESLASWYPEDDVLQWYSMSIIVSQISDISNVCSTACSDQQKRKHQSSPLHALLQPQLESALFGKIVHEVYTKSYSTNVTIITQIVRASFIIFQWNCCLKDHLRTKLKN